MILNKAMCIDSLIEINSLRLAAKLKLFIAIRESIHIALLRIKFV